jgi:NAD+ dependent glucose-6-phosphate dehydrogenase
MSAKTTVLITGATGNIGRKLRAHLEASGAYDLRLLCLNPGRDPAVQTADLSVYDEAWASAFDGVDTVLHIAADPSPWASWGRVQQLNLDLLFNVMAAAQQRRVRRVVFASSNFVVAGYRFRRERLTTDLEPLPINAYGASKLVGERLGKMFAERYGMSFIAFRIGVCQRANDNRFGPWISFSDWGQAMWVSDRDLCRAFQAGIDDRDVGFAVYNLVSNNPGMRWDLEDLRRDLKFTPRDGEAQRLTLAHRLRAAVAWLRLSALPAVIERIPGRRW